MTESSEPLTCLVFQGTPTCHKGHQSHLTDYCFELSDVVGLNLRRRTDLPSVLVIHTRSSRAPLKIETRDGVAIFDAYVEARKGLRVGAIVEPDLSDPGKASDDDDDDENADHGF